MCEVLSLCLGKTEPILGIEKSESWLSLLPKKGEPTCLSGELIYARAEHKTNTNTCVFYIPLKIFSAVMYHGFSQYPQEKCKSFDIKEILGSALFFFEYFCSQSV